MLRISTGSIYDLGTSAILDRTRDLVRTQQQLSTGRRVLAPSDDPIAATRILETRQAQEITRQYRENGASAQSNLALYEAALADLTELIHGVKTLAINAGDGALADGDLQGIRVEIEQRYRELIGLANRTDGNDQFLFSGFMSTTLPFAETSPGVVSYFGDQGQRVVQVSKTRSIATNDAGPDVFMQIPNGNGTFVTAAATTNTGSGVVAPGSVTNAAALTRHDYTVTFAVSATGATTYDVVDNTTATAIVTGAAYSSGGAITFDGLQFDVNGVPATGDSFTVRPSTPVSLFRTLADMRDSLQVGSTGAQGYARLANALNTAQLGLQNALDHALTVSASVGARMREVEELATGAEDLDLQYDKTLSGLQDVDYARAVSELTLQQTYLEAAQKSFARVTSLGLFNYL